MSNAILSHSKFIHIPKCGGTAIQTTLWNIGCITDKSQVYRSPHNGHLFASQMEDDGKPCFAFVRNPVTWWQSYYYWNMNTKHSRFDGDELKTTSFDQWVDEYGQYWLGKFTLNVKRYLGEDENFPTTNIVNHVGKTETVFEDLKRILDELEQPYNKNRLNDIINGSYKNWPESHVNVQKYDKTAVSFVTKQIIYKTEKDIFDRFGYSI